MTDALCISTRTLVGPQRFITGSTFPSTPFERELSFTSLSKQAMDLQNCWRHSNTGALVYLHRLAVSPALPLRSSEREKKLSNRVAVSSFIQNLPVDLRSPTDLSDNLSRLIFNRSHVHASYIQER